MDVEKLKDRFFSRVVVAGGCHLWDGPTHNGYGILYANVGGKRRMIRAHRFAWELENGPIPAGKCVLHRCDVRYCVNPHHLFIGTRADNNKDMHEKGRNRAVRGNDVNTARLTAKDVRNIITLSVMLGRDNESIAKKYGVTRGAISKIMNGRAWSHVTGIKRIEGEDRTPRGKENKNTRLTWEDVEAIRTSEGSNAFLAQVYGVAQGHISRIRRKLVWKRKA